MAAIAIYATSVIFVTYVRTVQRYGTHVTFATLVTVGTCE